MAGNKTQHHAWLDIASHQMLNHVERTQAVTLGWLAFPLEWRESHWNLCCLFCVELYKMFWVFFFWKVNKLGSPPKREGTWWATGNPRWLEIAVVLVLSTARSLLSCLTQLASFAKSAVFAKEGEVWGLEYVDGYFKKSLKCWQKK